MESKENPQTLPQIPEGLPLMTLCASRRPIRLVDAPVGGTRRKAKESAPGIGTEVVDGIVGMIVVVVEVVGVFGAAVVVGARQSIAVSS